VAKVTLYVPDDLAVEAKNAELPQSSLYQDALRAELDRVKARQQDASELDRAVARLRGTRDEEAQQRLGYGRSDGATWAREYATLGELSAMRESQPSIWRRMAWLSPPQAAEVGTNIPNAIPESATDYVGGFDREYLDGMGLSGDIAAGRPYWEGFQRGAIEVYDVVRRRL
jgi:post-segregation antitoxin (ccd killing protein)